MLLALISSHFSWAETPSQASVFRLGEAESTALITDPRLRAAQSRVDAATASITAEGQLPDPQLRLALLNLPTDSFNFDQEPMTQVFAGFKQTFPAGDTLSIKKAVAESAAEMKKASLETQRAVVLRDLRQLWLNVYASDAELDLIRQERSILDAMIPAATGAYRAGKGTQTEVVKIKLKLAALDEDEAALEGLQSEARAALGQWFESVSNRQWPSKLPASLVEAPPQNIDNNPEVTVLTAKIKTSEEKVALAHQAYKPQWGVEGSYGYRRSRADFLSLGLSVSLPLFTSTRQDPRIKASKADLLAAQWDKQHLLVELKTRLNKTHASVAALDTRVNVYENKILPELDRIHTLTKYDFRAGKSTFSDILQAQEALLKAKRKQLLLSLERARKIIDIRFLSGGLSA